MTTIDNLIIEIVFIGGFALLVVFAVWMGKKQKQWLGKEKLVIPLDETIVWRERMTVEFPLDIDVVGKPNRFDSEVVVTDKEIVIWDHKETQPSWTSIPIYTRPHHLHFKEKNTKTSIHEAHCVISEVEEKKDQLVIIVRESFPRWIKLFPAENQKEKFLQLLQEKVAIK